PVEVVQPNLHRLDQVRPDGSDQRQVIPVDTFPGGRWLCEPPPVFICDDRAGVTRILAAALVVITPARFPAPASRHVRPHVPPQAGGPGRRLSSSAVPP